MPSKLFLFGLSVMVLVYQARAQSTLKGQFTAVGLVYADRDNSFSLRYIPTWSAEQPDRFSKRWDVEIAGNFHYLQLAETSRDEINPSFTFYRFWTRFSTDRFEARIGLQKITFGPARLYRSLMWFDQLDPSDPQQLTGGVHAMRLRYDFQNNAGIWLWGLYNLPDLYFWNIINDKNLRPEYGGRVQYPTGPGEIGATYHYNTNSPNSEFGYKEERFALDGIWDIGIGVWFESVCIRVNKTNWQSLLTIGSDYTLGIGSGLTITGELFRTGSGDRPGIGWNDELYLGLIGSYPINILDHISLYSIYITHENITYQFLSWQRTYDRWIIHYSLFRSGGKSSLSGGTALTTMGSNGIQLTIIFNH